MADGNMANISPAIPINISRDPCKIENVYIGVECSHAEIQEYTELFKVFHDVFLVHTKKCQVSTLALLKMRLKLIPMLSIFDNACVW